MLASLLVVTGLVVAPTSAAEAEDDLRFVFTQAPWRFTSDYEPLIEFELRGSTDPEREHQISFRCESDNLPFEGCDSPYAPVGTGRDQRVFVRVEAHDTRTGEVLAVAERHWLWDNIPPGGSPIYAGTDSRFHVTTRPRTTFRWETVDEPYGSGFAEMDVRITRSSARAKRRPPWTYPRRLQGVATRSVTLRVRPGEVVCADVRFRDRAGNQSRWRERATLRQCVSRVFRLRDHRLLGQYSIVKGKRFANGRAVRLPPKPTKSRISLRVPRGSRPVIVYTARKGGERFRAKGPRTRCSTRWTVVYRNRVRRKRHRVIDWISVPTDRTGRVSVRSGDPERGALLEGIGFAPRWVERNVWPPRC
ncbi:hypothetical protein [Mumia flava]|uniref:hypothetical protein n=1 Tax=Mumia flava TaxID=1348852 RepID=UPI000C23FC8A|nr:hypothetical protein [Mumia flava]